MQTARLVPSGTLEITPQYSRTRYSANGISSDYFNHYGVQLAGRTSARSEFRVRVERLTPVGASGGLTVVSLGPKFSLVEDRLAFSLPLGVAVASNGQPLRTLTTAPTLLYSLPLNEWLEFTTTGKVFVPLNDSFDVTTLSGAATFGVSIGSRTSGLALRPEIGFAKRLQYEGTLVSFGVGVSLPVGQH